MTVIEVFARCVEAIHKGKLIVQVSRTDKEFHFQNWIKERLNETGMNFEQGGRNSYPDFRMVKYSEGYEVKGLKYPGREVTFDGNSQVPTGYHNGRTIYYMFGRYPANPDGNAYPVLDLVICHGDFLNADREYVHENKSVRGFGTYGDIMIRDRKMYVIPTPFGLVDGVAHHNTLILPANVDPGTDFIEVGELRRIEADEMVVGYSFDLKTNTLTVKKILNPGTGKEHVFRAWRVKGDPLTQVIMRPTDTAVLETGENELEEDATCD